MERMPLPCAMGLALDAFKKFSHLRGEFLESILDIQAFFSCVVDGAKSHLK
ncbi:hypothetical protein [Sphingobacterium sp.]|uniref:hypothetical protein n=1 Tax=Sphingobacterium sp. TaxID=341027 RepID=UPI0028AF97FC|nr:hypothetical protein [Sphingobacterium sp.]